MRPSSAPADSAATCASGAPRRAPRRRGPGRAAPPDRRSSPARARRHWRARPAGTADRTARARAPGSPATPATTSARETPKLPVASGSGSPSSSCERTDQRTSSGATPARTSERVALRHPSQSVSLASTIRRIGRANPIPSGFPTPGGTVCSVMTHDPEAFAAIGAAAAPAFSRDGQTLFHLRGSGLPQVWALDLATGADRQLTFHDEKVALLRRSPVDDRLIYGIDRGGDERQQLLLIDPRDASPEPRELTANPAVIHDFGGWSPDGAQHRLRRERARRGAFRRLCAGCRERRSPARVTTAATWSACPASAPTARRWRCCTIVATATCRCCCSMSRRARRSQFGVAEQLPERALGERRSHAAGADRSRRQRLPATVPAGSGDRRGHRSSMKLAGATWRPGRSRPMRALLATVENDRGYAVLRVGPIDGERPVVTGLPRGVVTDLAWSPDGSALAFSAAAPTEPPSLWLWRDGAARVVWQPEPRSLRASSISSWWRGRASTAHAFPAGSRCRAVRSRPAAIPRSSGCMAGRSARRGRISGPTSRCCSRRASPCCCRMCAAVPAMAAPTPRATMSSGGSTA